MTLYHLKLSTPVITTICILMCVQDLNGKGSYLCMYVSFRLLTKSIQYARTVLNENIVYSVPKFGQTKLLTLSRFTHACMAGVGGVHAWLAWAGVGWGCTCDYWPHGVTNSCHLVWQRCCNDGHL